MTSVWPLVHVSCVGGSRNSLSNAHPRSESSHCETKCERIAYGERSVVRVRNFSLKQGVLFRQFGGNCEVWESDRKKQLLRRRCAGLRGCCGALAEQRVSYQCGRFFQDKPGGLLTGLLPTARKACLACRVQSIEGAERSVNQEQTKLEASTEGDQGSGEVQQVHRQESDTPFDTSSRNAEQVGGAATGEERILNSAGDHSSETLGNGKASSDSSSDRANGVSRDGAGETVSTEGLPEYGTEPDWDEENQYVTRISVARERYISVPKVDLVNVLLLLFFPANKDSSEFLSICSYLELILHAEHKVELEELRSDYSMAHSTQDSNLPESKLLRIRGATNTTKLGPASFERAQKQVTAGEAADWREDLSTEEQDGSRMDDRQAPLKGLLDLPKTVMASFKQKLNGDGDATDAVEAKSQQSSIDDEAREAAAERFQKNIMKLLRHAEFQGLSNRDLELTAALNSDYLLTLPVDVDWKRAASSNVRIFRRGYTTEEEKGLLLGEKLDYLQSLVLRKTFKGFTRPLLAAGRWCLQKWKSLWNDEEGRELAESLSRWLQEPLQPENAEPADGPDHGTDNEVSVRDGEAELDMPIWIAGRQAVPRYEAVLSSAGSRGLLIRRILVRMGLLQPEPPSPTLPMDGDESVLEPHLRPNHLSRVSMKDIWQPALKGVVGRNPLKLIRAAFSVFFSQSILQEPAFKELVLLYDGDGQGSEEPGLRLQTYKKIPLPDLKIVFPSKKFIFRLLDTVRLDVTSVTGLLAFMVNYHFDDFLSSPSAFVLDLIAASALIVFVTRVSFGYKQVWDRYQLLVSKTLYEKTLASGFGVVQFLLDESEEQQFKEAILVLLFLTHQGSAEGMTKNQLADACERFLYYRCKEQVEMPVETAVRTLIKYGLIVVSEEGSTSSTNHGDAHFKALPYDQALTALEQHWVSLPSNISHWKV